MPLPNEHPDAAMLQAYLHGRLPSSEAALLDRHLESCDECGARLEQVGSDTYSDLLRLPATQAFTGSIENLDTDLPAELRSHSRYQVQDQLGRGGMGVVYRAVHRMMNRPVALKIIRPEYLSSPQAVDRFRREVRAAAQLAHPNIVAAYDAEEVGGIHFLVMEYVDGKTLDAIVAKRGPLTVPIACNLARQVALGLDHAHSRGMVHRDIKPMNLILADKSKVKILDFGLALSRSPGDQTEPGTREGIMLGTMIYSAPEQRKSAGTVDARADLYSLGATLAFLLIGDHPIDYPKWPESIPEGVRAVLNKLMTDSPDDRYPSAKAAAEALAPWCSTKPPAVEGRDARSRRLPVILASCAAVLAVAFGIWALTRERSNTSTASNPEPTQPGARPEPKWTSLLDFDPAKQSIGGNWTMTKDGLHVAPVLAARIAIPATVPAEYDLRVEFTRHTGSQSIGAVIVQNGRKAVFELDAWNKNLGGFQNVGGRTLIDNPTRREGVRLNNGRRYTMLVEVRRNSLRGLLDGSEIARHATDGSDLSLNEEWPMPASTGLGLVAWNSGVTFHKVELNSPPNR